jgi:hypothetical protein
MADENTNVNTTLQVFNGTQVKTESWALQGAVVMWKVGDGLEDMNEQSATAASQTQTADKGGMIPLLMNQINVRYGVPVSTFTPLNTSGSSAKRILIKGVPEGTLTVQSIFTPNVQNLSRFLEACQKTCRSEKEQVGISIRPFGTLECNGSADFKPADIVFYLRGLDLRQFDFTISQQDQIAMTNMPLTFQFFGLEIAGIVKKTGGNQ